MSLNFQKYISAIPDEEGVSGWDGFVSVAPGGHFMQSYSWGQFKELHGWTSHYLQWKDEQGAIVACALVIEKRIPLIGKRIMYAPRGPVIGSANSELLMAVLADIREYTKQQHAFMMRFDPYWKDEAELEGSLFQCDFVQVLTRKWSYWNQSRLVLWLPLGGSEEDVMKLVDPKCRRDIKSGYKKGVTYSQGDRGHIPEFYRLLAAMSSRKDIAAHEMDYYRSLYDVMARSGKVSLHFASHPEGTASVGMTVTYGDKAWLMYAASAKELQHLRTSRTIQWEMIKMALEAGCTRYDLQGTATSDPPVESDPGYGVYVFKKSFGPEYVRLAPYFDVVVGNLWYRVFRITEERLLPVAYRFKTWLDAKFRR